MGVLTLAGKLLLRQTGARSVLKALVSNPLLCLPAISRDFFQDFFFFFLPPVLGIKLRLSLLLYDTEVWLGIHGLLGVMNWHDIVWCGEGFGGCGVVGFVPYAVPLALWKLWMDGWGAMA